MKPSRLSRTALMTLTMLVAVILCAVLILRMNARHKQLADLTQALSDSQATWQGISDAKEELLDELATAKSDLREAQTSLDEATEKSADLTVQIGELTDSNAVLTAQLTDARDALPTEEAAADTLSAHTTTMAEYASVNGVDIPTFIDNPVKPATSSTTDTANLRADARTALTDYQAWLTAQKTRVETELADLHAAASPDAERIAVLESEQQLLESELVWVADYLAQLN